MKKILGLLATGCLALAANSASAIPLQIDVAGGGGGVGGVWHLTGQDSGFHASGAWGVLLDADLESWVVDIDPGEYLWEFSGGGGFAVVIWTLRLGGEVIHSGLDGNPLWFFSISDQHQFEVVTAVPEPGTLGLLGLGLWAAGFAAIRRRNGQANV